MFVCDICSEFGLFKDGVYRCSKCYYDVHIECIQDKHKEKIYDEEDESMNSKLQLRN